MVIAKSPKANPNVDISAERRAPSAERRAPSAERRAPSYALVICSILHCVPLDGIIPKSMSRPCYRRVSTKSAFVSKSYAGVVGAGLK
jgi:hypothetical protein